jgi:hypothetical protein
MPGAREWFPPRFPPRRLNGAIEVRRSRVRHAGTPTRSAGGLQLVTERDPDARLFQGSGADALRTSIAKACKEAGVRAFSPHDLRHRRISLLHLRGVP